MTSILTFAYPRSLTDSTNCSTVRESDGLSSWTSTWTANCKGDGSVGGGRDRGGGEVGLGEGGDSGGGEENDDPVCVHARSLKNVLKRELLYAG